MRCMLALAEKRTDGEWQQYSTLSKASSSWSYWHSATNCEFGVWEFDSSDRFVLSYCRLSSWKGFDSPKFCAYKIGSNHYYSLSFRTLSTLNTHFRYMAPSLDEKADWKCRRSEVATVHEHWVLYSSYSSINIRCSLPVNFSLSSFSTSSIKWSTEVSTSWVFCFLGGLKEQPLLGQCWCCCSTGDDFCWSETHCYSVLVTALDYSARSYYWTVWRRLIQLLALSCKVRTWQGWYHLSSSCL